MFVVTGSSSELDVTGKILINNANGDSEVSDGGKLEAGGLTIAGRSGTNLGLNVSGDGSAFTANGTIIIGEAGTGALTVTDKAALTAAGQTIVLGKNAGARGNLTLTDAAGTIGASDLIIGDAGAGFVTINGGSADTVNDITIGKHQSGGGVLAVSNGGHLKAGDVDVGLKGDGSGIIVYNADSKFEADTLALGGSDPDPADADEQLCGTWVYKGGHGNMGVSNDGFATVGTSVTLKGDGTDSAILAIATGGGMVIGGDGSRQADQITIKANGDLTGHGLVTVGQETADGL
jgi:T5SS/PEP-CTERM-associated repeat protein